MAKLTIFLCLLIAVACVPSSQAGLFDSWGDRIHQAQEKVSKLVVDAIENFKKQVEAIKQHALDIAANLKKQGEEIMEGVNSKISDVLQGIDERLEKITGDAEGVDVTECTDMAKEIKTTGLTVLANASYCVVDKIDQASGYIEGINAASQGALQELIKINDKANECTANIKGIESSIKALACLGIAMKDATLAVTRKIPDVVINITKMGYLISTLIPSLSLCSATASIGVLIDEANAVMSSVEACVNEKIGDHFQTTVSTVSSTIGSTVQHIESTVASTLASTLGSTVEHIQSTVASTLGSTVGVVVDES
ncbi:hypothetical protein KPH14_009128 [Odynerus spinipes]|uniref:Uncharacterized protein n=1 Tax=Odynerus spinipes TaxID=1348599 RepID=A0AAD9RPS7_9HYME|nr:hypothetical protein KPH14_009128 [Odynerus spinipes]